MIKESILALLVAIRAVESCDGLDRNARDNVYQITPVCLRDVNRIYGLRYRWPRDVRDRETAEEIVVLYLSYYGMIYTREFGRIPSKSVLARIYHCGYEGFKRGDGKSYERKIRKAAGK